VSYQTGISPSFSAAYKAKVERALVLFHTPPSLLTSMPDLREGDSPSFFNIEEASQIHKLIVSLVSTTDIEPSEIGVITPYYKQAQVTHFFHPSASDNFLRKFVCFSGLIGPTSLQRSKWDHQRSSRGR
jgi:hypothetical protein